MAKPQNSEKQILLEILNTLGGGGGGISGNVTVDNPWQHETRMFEYTAIASGTGYSIGDAIWLLKLSDIAAGAYGTTTEVWYNQTTNAVISAPLLANLRVNIKTSAGATATLSILTLATSTVNLAFKARQFIFSNDSDYVASVVLTQENANTLPLTILAGQTVNYSLRDSEPAVDSFAVTNNGAGTMSFVYNVKN